MITLENWITAEEVVEFLNITPPDPSSYGNFLQAYWNWSGASADSVAELSNDVQDWVERTKSKSTGFPSNYLLNAITISPSAIPPEGVRSPDRSSREWVVTIEKALTSAQLRSLVDEWLDTGRGPDEDENPSVRELGKTEGAFLTTAQFLNQNPSFLFPESKGVNLRLRISDPFEVGAKQPGLFTAPKHLFTAPRHTAAKLFVGILASEWQARLSKCRYAPCGKYFLSEKLRRHYRRGTFCSDAHRTRHSAERLTRERRKRAQLELVEMAARWLIKKHCTAAWQTDPIRKDLAIVLSEEMGRNPTLRTNREQVKVNWVTRNRVTIERRRAELSV